MLSLPPSPSLSVSVSLCLPGPSAPTGLAWFRFHGVGLSATLESRGCRGANTRAERRSKGGPAHFCSCNQARGDVALQLGPPCEGALETGSFGNTPPPPCPLSFFPSSTRMMDWGPGCPLGRCIQPPWAVVAPGPGAGQVSSTVLISTCERAGGPKNSPESHKEPQGPLSRVQGWLRPPAPSSAS